jgi:hypothetical protein
MKSKHGTAEAATNRLTHTWILIDKVYLTKKLSITTNS